jgi:hypothetical protein
MKLRDILGSGGLSLIAVPKHRINGNGNGNGRYAGNAQRADSESAPRSKSRHRDTALR